MEEKQTGTTLSGEHWLSYILPVSLIAGLVALLTIIADQPMEELQPIIPQEEWLTQFVGWLIMLAEAAAALVIGAAVVRASARPRNPARRRRSPGRFPVSPAGRRC